MIKNGEGLVSGTRVFGKLGSEEFSVKVDPFIDQASKYGRVLIVSQTSYPHVDSLKALVNSRQQGGMDIGIKCSETKGADSPADMCNQIIIDCAEKGLDFFAVISSDLAGFIPQALPVLVDYLVANPDIISAGVAIQNVHNLSLVKNVQEHGQDQVGIENYATIFHNNAFAVHRFHIPGLDYDGRIFPRVTDQGKLGEIMIDGDTVKIGGNEEIALMLQALSQGVEIPTRLLAEKQTLIRDPKAEISSVDKKVARRPQVARKYQEHYEVSDERLLQSLRKNFRIIFDA